MFDQDPYELKALKTLLILDQGNGILHDLEEELKKNYVVLHSSNTGSATQQLYENDVQVLICSEQSLGEEKETFLEHLKNRFPHTVPLLFSQELNHEMETALNKDSAIKFVNTSATMDLGTALKSVKDQYNLTSTNQNTDFLTKLKNTLALNSILEQEIRRSQRYKRNLSCVMVDVDQLKLINDAHGFGTGDQVLKELAETLKAKVRESDHLGRLREDNFLAILPECGEEELQVFVQRCTQVMNNLALNTEGAPISFSVSISYITIPFDVKITVREVLKILHEGTTEPIEGVKTQPPVQFKKITEDLSKLNMLVVDDEESILLSLQSLFRKDYNITTANSSEKALSLIESYGKNFAIVLTDQRMGGMQGSELLKVLNQRYDDDMVGVLITGYSDLESVADAINQGHVYAYITKPWDVRELKNIVKNCERIYRLRRENKLLTRNLISANSMLEERVRLRTKELEHANIELQSEVDKRQQVENILRESSKELQSKHNDLKATQSQLVQAAKLSSLGEMATSIAHEINQPLQIIRLSVEIVQHHIKMHEYEKIEGKLGMMLDQVERASKITNHMRTFGRDSGDVEKQLISINTVVEDAYTLIQHQLVQFDITLGKQLDEDLPKVKANPLHIEQVLVNLISNARDALEGLPAKLIEIETSFTPDHVILKISDNGSGIPDDVKERIFDPFFTTKDVGHGTGLGMSISYGIIQDHGGTILLDTKIGKGTTFTIQLPRGSFDSED